MYCTFILSQQSACWVSSCFHNPLNSAMDYRIFSVRTWSFLCECIHTEVGHIDSESAQHFWVRKAHNFFYCVPDGLRTCPMDLQSDALPNAPPHHPSIILDYITFLSQCNAQGNVGCFLQGKARSQSTALPSFFFFFCSCVQCFCVFMPPAMRPTLLKQIDMGSLTMVPRYWP